MLTRGGIGTQELHCRQSGVEVPQTIGDHFVIDVTVEIDNEAIVAEPLLCRPRLQLGQVEVAGGELTQDRMQTPGPVLELKAHDARLVVSGRRRDAMLGPGHGNETRGVVIVVLDVAGSHVQAVKGCGQLRPDRRGPCWPT